MVAVINDAWMLLSMHHLLLMQVLISPYVQEVRSIFQQRVLQVQLTHGLVPVALLLIPEQLTINNANGGDAGTYTVTVTLNGCSDNDALDVTVNAPPTANAGADITVCTGGTINLAATSVAGATYAWTGPGGIYC